MFHGISFGYGYKNLDILDFHMCISQVIDKKVLLLYLYYISFNCMLSTQLPQINHDASMLRTWMWDLIYAIG